MKKPKILLLDIESTPNLVYSWRLGKQYITIENIHKERKISCICYKWKGESKIHSLEMDLSKHHLWDKDDNADEKMLKKFCDIYQEADLAVGHNAIKFDVSFIRSRLIKYGLPDIAPVIVDDTYLASTPIGFNSHKLDYLSQYLGHGKKAPHPYKLWVDVMNGDRKALTDTVNYCKQDVRLLEKVYDSLLPYIKTKLNRATFAQDSQLCPSCGWATLVRNKEYVSATGGVKLTMRCSHCGKYSTKSLKSIKDSKSYPRAS